MLFIMFCILGGVYVPNIASPTMKKMYFTIGILGLCSSVLGIFGYVFIVNEVDIADMLYLLSATSGQFYLFVFLPLITYYFRTNLKTVLQNIDNEFDCYEPKTSTTDITRTKYDSTCEAANWFMCLIMVEILFLLPNLVYAAVFCDNGCLADVQLYFFFTPFYWNTDSFTIYTIIYIFQSFLVMSTFMVSNGTILFCLIIGTEFYNAYRNLCIQIDCAVAGAAAGNWKARAELETYSCFERNGMTAEDFQTRLFRKFKITLTKIVKHHQNFVR